MDYFIEKELNILKGEIEETQELNLASQYLYASKLEKGLGDEIKEFLKNPPAVNKKEMKKYRRKKKKEKAFFRISQIFGGKDNI